MNPLNADQREQQLTRLLEAVSKERDAALAQLELERREKGELVAKWRAACVELLDAEHECMIPPLTGDSRISKHRRSAAAWDVVMKRVNESAALTPQEAPDGQ
jgi:hypothetical protein